MISLNQAKLSLIVYACIWMLFSGCVSSSENNERYKIGFSQCIGSDQWRITMLKEMRRELSFHPQVEFLYQDAEGSSVRQVEQVKALIESGIDLLIVSPNEAQPLTPIVEMAYERGIPVVVIDRKIASNKYTAYVGADNYEIGTIAGNYVAEKLGKKGNIIEVLGLPRSSPAMERERGFAEALRPYPSIKIIHQYYGNWLKQDAAQQAAGHIKQFANADAVFAHNDQMAYGIYQELKKQGLNGKIKLIGVDALAGKDNGLDFVAAQILDASVLYPTGGKEAIRTAFSILKHQPFNKNNILKTLVIDSSNVQLMKMQEERMDSQQHDIERQQQMLAEQKKIYRNQQFTLNILVVSLVFAVVFGGIAFYSLTENWKNNKRLEVQNREIMASEKRLREMTEKAAEANEAKMQFFTNISHEFRTPITLILLPIEELLKEKQLAEKIKDRLRLLQKNAYRLLKMVNELIDFRKIEYDKMTLNLTRVDIVVLIKEIVHSFKDMVDKKQLDLRVNAIGKPLLVPVDLQLFDKVMFNLLANAIKFTPNYGHVIVDINEYDQQVEIKITDSGIGMGSEELKHAFELFYQGKGADLQGSGLGLALSRQIVELHQGSICLESEKDKGTICKILLPLYQATENPEIEKSTYLVPDYLARQYTMGASAHEQTNRIEEEGKSIHDKSILIIEDHEDMRLYLKEQLSATYEIWVASNGKEGFSLAITHVPDIIISDIIMPEANGIETTKQLKSDLRTSHIPIILLTAKGNHEHRLEGLNTLADGYLAKPFHLEELQATIRNILSNRELLKHKFTSDLPITGGKGMGKLDKKFVNDLSSLVEANLSNENLSVEDISAQMGLSRVQLYRKAKALLDCSMAEYILNRRLQKAKYMLLNEPDLSIAEITFQTGFTSPNYFATVFKSKYGVTPTEFRRNAID